MDTSADVGVTFGNPVHLSYNATDDRYFVVWRCDDVLDNLIVNGEFEIHGRLVNGDGTLFGAEDFQISGTGGANGTNTGFDAESPRCAWNSDDNEFLVVWGADQPALGDGDREIHGQLLDNVGQQIGTNDFQVSSTVQPGSKDSAVADVVYNPTTDEYLVVWSGDIDADDVLDIYGQLVTASGAPSGTAFQISETATVASLASEPRVVYNSVKNEFLATWHGALAPGEEEIFCQRLSAAGGDLGGDVRVSDLGPDGNANFDAQLTHGVAYANSGLNSYCVAFHGSDNRDGQVQGENEVFVQFIDSVLEIEKTLVTATTGADAGDVIEYEIRVRHKKVMEGSDEHPVSLRDAFNVSVTDDVPDLLGNVTIVTAEISDAMTMTDVSGSFAVSPAGDLETTGTVDLLLGTNGDTEELLIVIQGTIPDTAGPGDVVSANTVEVTWEGVSGGLSRPGYCAEATVDSFDIAGAFAVSRTVDGAMTVPILSTVTYEITTTIVEGTTENLQYVDTFPGGAGNDGLTYVPGSATISDAGGMTINGFNAANVGQTLTIDVASVVNPGDVDDPGSVDTDSFAITYQMEVDPSTAGGDLINDLDATADGVPPDVDNQTTLAVIKADSATMLIGDDPDPSVTGEEILVSYDVVPVAPATTTPTGAVMVDVGGESCVVRRHRGLRRLHGHSAYRRPQERHGGLSGVTRISTPASRRRSISSSPPTRRRCPCPPPTRPSSARW